MLLVSGFKPNKYIIIIVDMTEVLHTTMKRSQLSSIIRRRINGIILAMHISRILLINTWKKKNLE